MDAYATQNLAPIVDIIFKSMKAFEERWNSRNEREQADFVGHGSGYLPKSGDVSALCQTCGNALVISYCCGKSGHIVQVY